MEGEGRSEVSREEAHGHIEQEGIVSKVIRKVFAPFGLLQPDSGYVQQPSKRSRDPEEETPAEEIRELESEKMGGTPPQS